MAKLGFPSLLLADFYKITELYSGNLSSIHHLVIEYQLNTEIKNMWYTFLLLEDFIKQFPVFKLFFPEV
jgi:hypothetical protein